MLAQCGNLATRQNTINAETIERLRALPLFAALDVVGLATLLKGATICTVSRHESLFQKGTSADRFYIVLSGLVALLLTDETGRESVVAIVKSGDTFGEEDVFDRSVFSFAARVIANARLVEVPGEIFLQALITNFKFFSLIVASMSAHLHCLVRQIGELKLKSSEQRLAGYIVELAQEISGKARITLPYEKKIIASQLSMQPETLSRALVNLRKLGVRAYRNVFIVEDVSRLRAFCYVGDFPTVENSPLLPCITETKIMNAMGNGVLLRADYCEVRRFDIFSNFSDDELSRLLRGAICRTCRRGTVLFVQGDKADRFFLVLSGRVKLIQRLESGEEGLVEIFGTGQSFGEAVMLTAQPFPVGGEAIADCKLIQIAAEPFLSELINVPALALKVLANLARLHHRLLRQLCELRFKSPRQRFIAYLLTLTTVTNGQARIQLSEDKSIIASRIGISAESLSRLLIRLRKNGVQCYGREIVLENVQDLHVFCAQGGNALVRGNYCYGAIGCYATKMQCLKQENFRTQPPIPLAQERTVSNIGHEKSDERLPNY